jgi:hypothetical protein
MGSTRSSESLRRITVSGPHYRKPQAPVPDLELLVIDGDNLLHRVRGMRDDAGLHWLLPRLRAWRPAGVQVLLMLDGSPGPGMGRRQQAAPGIQMQHSGRLDADTAIVELVRARGYAERMRTVVVTDDRQLSDRVRYGGVLVRRLDWLIDLLGRPNPGSAEAAKSVAMTGPATIRTAPAASRTTSASGSGPGRPSPGAGQPSPRAPRAAAGRARPPVGIGGGKPPRPDATTPIVRDPDDAHEPWKPGRGATTKRGNPRRAAKGPTG